MMLTTEQNLVVSLCYLVLCFCFILIALYNFLQDEKIKSTIRKIFHIQEYEYGYVKQTRARRNRFTGEVQFVLWKAGEQGHNEDYWHKFDSSWWPLFIRDT